MGIIGVLIALLKVALLSVITIVCVLAMIWSYCTIFPITGPGLLTFLPPLGFGFIATFACTAILNIKNFSPR